MHFKLEELEKLGMFKRTIMDDENDFYLFCDLSKFKYEDIGLMAYPVCESALDDITKVEWEVALFPYDAHKIKTIEDIKEIYRILVG